MAAALIRAGTRRILATAVLVSALAGQATAEAAVVGMVQRLGFRTFVYSAAPGEVNRLTVAPPGDASPGAPDVLAFRDPGTPITALRPCAAVALDESRCEGVQTPHVELGDEDDALDYVGPSPSVKGGPGDDTMTVSVAGPELSTAAIDGESGNDTLIGSQQADHINGDAGDDLIGGRSGADFLRGGPGTDTYDAGPGDDFVFLFVGPVDREHPDSAAETVECSPGDDEVVLPNAITTLHDCEIATFPALEVFSRYPQDLRARPSTVRLTGRVLSVDAMCRGLGDDHCMLEVRLHRGITKIGHGRRRLPAGKWTPIHVSLSPAGRELVVAGVPISVALATRERLVGRIRGAFLASLQPSA